MTPACSDRDGLSIGLIFINIGQVIFYCPCNTTIFNLWLTHAQDIVPILVPTQYNNNNIFNIIL